MREHHLAPNITNLSPFREFSNKLDAFLKELPRSFRRNITSWKCLRSLIRIFGGIMSCRCFRSLKRSYWNLWWVIGAFGGVFWGNLCLSFCGVERLEVDGLESEAKPFTRLRCFGGMVYVFGMVSLMEVLLCTYCPYASSSSVLIARML